MDLRLLSVGPELRQAAHGVAVADCRALNPDDAEGHGVAVLHLLEGVRTHCLRPASEDRPPSWLKR